MIKLQHLIYKNEYNNYEYCEHALFTQTMASKVICIGLLEKKFFW